MANREGINKVLLAGTISREPRWHANGNGQWLCFPLVTKEVLRTAKGDGNHEETHHIRVSEYSSLLREHQLKKGDVIFLQGKIQTQAFTDEAHIRRYKTEIIALQIDRLTF